MVASGFQMIGGTMSIRKVALLSLLLVSIQYCPVFAQEFQGDPKIGEFLYEDHCIRCHGPKGDGNGEEGQYLVVKPANFHSAKSLVKTNSELFTIIKFGLIFSPMHGWGDRLTDEEIDDVIAYIRFLAPYRALADARAF